MGTRQRARWPWHRASYRTLTCANLTSPSGKDGTRVRLAIPSVVPTLEMVEVGENEGEREQEGWNDGYSNAGLHHAVCPCGRSGHSWLRLDARKGFRYRRAGRPGAASPLQESIRNRPTHCSLAPDHGCCLRVRVHRRTDYPVRAALHRRTHRRMGGSAAHRRDVRVHAGHLRLALAAAGPQLQDAAGTEAADARRSGAQTGNAEPLRVALVPLSCATGSISALSVAREEVWEKLHEVVQLVRAGHRVSNAYQATVHTGREPVPRGAGDHWLYRDTRYGARFHCLLPRSERKH